MQTAPRGESFWKSGIIIGSACLLLGLIAGAALGVTFGATAKRLIHAASNGFVEADRLEFLRRFPPQGSVAMIGDSHIEAGPWKELLGPEFANYGIGGDTTVGVLKRIEMITGKSAVLMIGVNDAIRGETIERIATNIAAIIDRLPMPVILLSIMPGIGGYETYNAKLAKVNAVIKTSCRPSNCQFIDTWPALTINGRLNPNFTIDGLHLNDEGYGVLAKLISAASPAASEE